MKPCEICGQPGQKHHIVFRSQGGMNIRLNYAYLCARHHTDGKEAVHNNRTFDLCLKIRLQRSLEDLFQAREYSLPEVAALIGYDRRRLGKRMKAVRQKCGIFRREDIIRFLMGGKVYAELSQGKEEHTEHEETEGFFLMEEE